jgi:ribosome-associated protein
MNHDESMEETEEGWDGPSRSQLRREALAVFELAERLMEQNESELARLPMEEDLRGLVRESQRITQQIARKRQTQFLAKNLRRLDDATLDAIRQSLEHAKADSRRDTAALHRIELWRDRLIDEGDAALAEFLTAYPLADRQHIRQLARNAHAERLQNKAPHAYRELFRALRELIEDHGAGEQGTDEA